MSFIKKHYINIINANNDNRLAVFIGAGISKSSESSTIKLPSWNDLIIDFKSELGLPKEENDFLKIAQLYFLEFKEFTYYEKLKSYFPNNIEPSLVHKLIFDINPQCIITTNWDTILEKTIENNAYIYDVVSSDEDLVKSTLQKKLIKMHGDFKNHNIVFKEDDYLNYRYNFPIIENYIKSILTTHTVLFAGYSYNDINLKLIMKWLQNHSKVSPPRYLIAFSKNPTQEKYLENHGITVLVVNDIDKKYNDLDKCSRKMATFLDLIAKPNRAYSTQNDDEIVEYIYDKLKILNNLDGILLEQIQKTLTNCGFKYPDYDLVLLQFYSNMLTTDLDEDEREIHKKFIGILKKYDKGKYRNINIEKILNILAKANIDGIIYSKDTDDLINYIIIRKTISNPVLQDFVNVCFDFSFSISNDKTNIITKMTEMAYQYYQIQNYENAYNVLEDVVTLCLKQRNYTQLFIAMFNRDIVLRILKYLYIGKGINIYKSVNEYDMKDRFNNLPKDLQKALEPIYNIVNFDYLYKYAFRVSSELKNKEDSKRTIEQGGMVFSTNITESSSKHKNLVLFLLQNKIMIDDYAEYKTINKYYIEIAIIRQVQKESTNLNIIELYSCIKYIDNKELVPLFKQFYSSNVDRQTKLTISEIDKEWLIEKVLANIGKLFMESNNMYNKYENCLENTIFMLSLVSIDNQQIDKIMDVFLNIISKAKNTIGIYKSINQFLGIQYELFKLDINDEALIKLIEVIIHKLVRKQYNAFDYHAITRNSIDNLYGYAKVNKAILNNIDLVSKLLAELSSHDITDKIRLSQSFLLSIYDISNNDIQSIIKSFILGVDMQIVNNPEEALTFELSLLMRKIKEFDASIIEKLNQYLEQFEDGKKFSSDLFTLENQLDYLVNKMSQKQFQDVLNKIKQAIDIYKSRKDISIF